MTRPDDDAKSQQDSISDRGDTKSVINTHVVDLNQSQPASPHSHRSETDWTDSSPGEPYNRVDIYKSLSNLTNEAIQDISSLAKS